MLWVNPRESDNVVWLLLIQSWKSQDTLSCSVSKQSQPTQAQAEGHTDHLFLGGMSKNLGASFYAHITVILVISFQGPGTANKLNIYLVTLSPTLVGFAWSWPVLQGHEHGIMFAVEVLQHSLEGLLTQRFLSLPPEFLIQWVWDGTQECSLLRCFQEMLILLFWGPRTENHWEPTIYIQPDLKALEASVNRMMLCMCFFSGNDFLVLFFSLIFI